MTVAPRAVLVVLMLFDVACAGSAPATTPPATAPPLPPAANPPAASAPAASSSAAPASSGTGAAFQANAAEWERLKEAARREGQVVVVGPTQAGVRAGLTEGFTRAHGITVEYLGLNVAEAETRLEREGRAGRPMMDIHIAGKGKCWEFAEQGFLENAARQVVDPAVLVPSVWFDGAPRPLRPSPTMPQDLYCGVQGTRFITTDLVVNTSLVPPGAIRSWRDLLKPEYRGKIASHDPRGPGSSAATVTMLYVLFGEQFLRDLYVGQEPTFTRDYRQLAEWVARGTYPIGLSLVQSEMEPLRAAGLPLERVFPADEAGFASWGFSVIRQIKGGPNPNAGAVFLNWFLTKEAQEVWEQEMLEASLRTDVVRKAPNYVVPKPGAPTIEQSEPEVDLVQRPAALDIISKLLPR